MDPSYKFNFIFFDFYLFNKFNKLTKKEIFHQTKRNITRFIKLDESKLDEYKLDKFV